MRFKNRNMQMMLGSVPAGPRYTSQQLINMSHAAMQNIINEDNQIIAGIDADLAHNASLMPGHGYDPETIAQINAVKVQYQVQVATIQSWLNLSQHQQATTDPHNFFINTATQFLNSYQNAINYSTGNNNNAQNNNGNNNSGNNIAGFDLGFLTQNIMGLPLWGWLAGAGVAYYALSKK